MMAVTPDSFKRVTAGFYRDADPDVAAEALAYVIDSDLPDQDPTLLLMFARMAEVYPEVRSSFSQLIPSLGPEAQKTVQLLVDLPEQLKAENYLPSSVMNPQALDLCWSEFLVTGAVEIVSQIIAVLDWEDLTRLLIDESLTNPDSAAIRLSAPQWQSFGELGILIGTTDSVRHPHIAVAGDIDLLIWRGLQKKHEASTLVLRQLQEEQVAHVATKGAAFWSLKSNSDQHAAVRELCDSESRVAGGEGRRYLADKVG